MIAVDIEAIHHDTKIWGADATMFRPSRWGKGKMSKSMISAFFPFGMKPLVCPAKKVFGPRIIGLFVASLSLALNRSGDLETVGATGFQSHGLLDNTRDSYETMSVRIKRGNLGSQVRTTDKQEWGRRP